MEFKRRSGCGYKSLVWYAKLLLILKNIDILQHNGQEYEDKPTSSTPSRTRVVYDGLAADISWRTTSLVTSTCRIRHIKD